MWCLAFTSSGKHATDFDKRRWVRTEFNWPVAKFLVTDWVSGDTVDTDIGFEYRHVKLHRLAGPYDNLLVDYIHQSGTKKSASALMWLNRPVPEIIDRVFAKTSQNARFLLSENERFGLVFVKTGSINSGTDKNCVQLSLFLMQK